MSQDALRGGARFLTLLGMLEVIYDNESRSKFEYCFDLVEFSDSEHISRPSQLRNNQCNAIKSTNNCMYKFEIYCFVLHKDAP